MEALQSEHTRSEETIALYEERIKEADLQPKKRVTFQTNGHNSTNGHSSDSDDEGSANRLGQSIRSETVTDLRIQIRRLERQLKSTQADKTDSSRIVVLENLLEDANSMKRKYEQDFLVERRQRLGLQNLLEEIRSGKADTSNRSVCSAVGLSQADRCDSAEAAVALRIRLAECVQEAETAKQQLSDLQSEHEIASRDLKLAQSDRELNPCW